MIDYFIDELAPLGIEELQAMSDSKNKLKVKAIDRVLFDHFRPDEPFNEEQYNRKQEITESHYKDSGGFKGKLNIYVCENCREHVVSRDLDHGTTPFMISCHAHKNSSCSGMMISSMYRVYSQNMKEDVQFYHPTYEEYKALPRHQQSHIEQFGLISRKAVFSDE